MQMMNPHCCVYYGQNAKSVNTGTHNNMMRAVRKVLIVRFVFSRIQDAFRHNINSLQQSGPARECGELLEGFIEAKCPAIYAKSHVKFVSLNAR